MGRRTALIIANDEYAHAGLSSLRSPAADAAALAEVLGNRQISEFDVQVVRNEPAHVVQSHIEDLFVDSEPDDVLLLHFSCHGVKSESGELFFAMRNTRPDRLGSTAVPADFVRRCMRTSRSRSIVLLLDCCYGGAFSEGVSVRAAGDVHVLDSLHGGRGRAVITASNSMEYAFEGDRLADDHSPRPSVFTAALVHGLATGEADRDEDGLISLNELYDYVFERVRQDNPNQTPSRDIEMQGELFLARSTRKRIRPQPLPPDLRAATTDPNMFTRLGAVGELRARLASDNPEVAAGAHEALTEMAGTDIQNVADAAARALREAGVPAGTPEVVGDRKVPPAEPRQNDPLPRWCGALAIAAAVLLVCGTLVSYRYDDSWLETRPELLGYMYVLAAAVLTAGVCVLVPPARQVGVGVLLAAATMSVWGLGIVVADVGNYNIDTFDGGFWLALSGFVALLCAAGLAVAVIRRDPHLAITKPATPTWRSRTGMALGVAAAVLLVVHLVLIGYVGYDEAIHMVPPLSAALMAPVVPVLALFASPRLFATAMFIGWAVLLAVISVTEYAVYVGDVNMTPIYLLWATLIASIALKIRLSDTV